jgi:hypothetical protein
MKIFFHSDFSPSFDHLSITVLDSLSGWPFSNCFAARDSGYSSKMNYLIPRIVVAL